MTNLTKALRAEMRAAARGESKQAVESLRAEIQAIRKSIAMLERRLLTGAVPGSGTRAAAAGKVADNRRARFSPTLMRKHREALGMSRKAYARLLGVSSLSVYLWEVGRTRPRRKTVLAWQDLRKKGARALRAIAGVVAPRRAAVKKRAAGAVAKKRAAGAVAKKRAPRATAKKRTRRAAAKRMSRAKAA